MPFEVYTFAEAAAVARVSARWLQMLAKAGSGPALTRLPGRRVVIRSDSLADWLVSRTVEPQQRAA